MALLRMAVENYRCFKERQELELRPITVVLGKNNSGKSALVRLPLLLETGIDSRSISPLNLESSRLVGDPPDFLELVYGQSPHRPLHLEFSIGARSSQMDVAVTVQNIAEYRTQIVSQITLAEDGEHYALEWQPRTPPRSLDRLSYNFVSNAEEPQPAEIGFAGILPDSAAYPTPSDDIEKILMLAAQVRDNWVDISHLGPYRELPERFMRLPSTMPSGVGAAGEDTAKMLVSDFARDGGVLLTTVNGLLDTNLPGWALEVEEYGRLFSLNLRSTKVPDLSVSLQDAGTGVAKVLPMIVQQAQRMMTSSKTESLQIIEEPEMSLHPAAHAVLADLFVAAAESGLTQFLVETHSETLLLRLRRRIAEGALSHENIAVYFVENEDGVARASRIEIDEFGNLGSWPAGVFSEDYEETKKLAEAQFSRDSDES